MVIVVENRKFSNRSAVHVPSLKRPFGPRRVRELVLSPTELLHRLVALLPKAQARSLADFGTASGERDP